MPHDGGMISENTESFRFFLRRAKMQIRKAVQEDIPGIADTYERLLTYEKEHGTHSHWELGVYPTAEVAETAVPKGTMYVLRDHGKICASMVLDHEQAPEYSTVPWKYESLPELVLVVHTLCVPPEEAGQGYGYQMVRFAKEYAAKTGCTCVRIDTWVHNEPAQHLYHKCGFETAGTGPIKLHGLIDLDQMYLEYRVPEKDGRMGKN